MAAETAERFGDLQALSLTLVADFVSAGYEAVSPAIIQPAGIFLDVIGEALRARTYVFNDPDGEELCLRPDLTVPTCRLHAARYADPATPAKYCYTGQAFRFQPQGADAAHPREFRQAGIEAFGGRNREAAEVEIVRVVVAALQACGLKEWAITLGDLGLLGAVLTNAGLPPQWRQRLAASFWRPEAFKAELKRLTSAPEAAAARLPAELRALLDPDDAFGSEQRVADYLDGRGVETIGVRTVEDVTAHLLEMVEDARAKPLPADTASLIEGYVAVAGPAKTAGTRIADILRGAKSGVGAALDAYDRRLALFANAGLDLDRITFSAEFGRGLEYYTGLVFEVSTTVLGAGSPVAGGGRYDSLMRAVGAQSDVPAVGAAIHTDRLLAALGKV